MRKEGIILIAFSLMFAIGSTSCSDMSDKRSVFENVVNGYSNTGDTLKRLAAEYLSEYASYHYGVPRSLPSSLDVTPFLHTHDTIFKNYLDSCRFTVKESKPILDNDTITEDFIRENIELAFDAWHKPWAKNLSFEEFCKYILPYRNSDEPLSNWRKYLKAKYEPSILDSVSNPASIREVAEYLMRCIRREVAYGPSCGAFYRRLLAPTDIERLHWVGCPNCAHYTTLVMRACGIPCAQININWRFTEIGHSSVYFPAIGSNKRAFRLTIGDPLMEMGDAKDSMASYRTWINIYEANSRLLDMMKDAQEHKGYKALQNMAFPVTREDVTAQLSRTFNFSMPVPDSLQNKKYLFLCRFYQWKWIPIREGIVEDDSVHFQDATIRQLYRLGYASGDTVCTVGTPFTLLGDPNIANVRQRLRPFDNTGDTVMFKRVYPCKEDEKQLTLIKTTYFWDTQNEWHPYTGKATLWGYNAKTDEYKVFTEDMRSTFKPVFYILEVYLPKWTMFTDNETPRLQGYLSTDPKSNEGYIMEF